MANKLAVLSDIHGNMHALKSVLKDAELAGVNDFVCLGDSIGYYYQGADVLRLIKENCKYSIAGNHEKMLQSIFDNTLSLYQCVSTYGSSYLKAIIEIDYELFMYVKALPDSVLISLNNDKSILAVHSHPVIPDKYVYPDNLKDLDNLSKYADIVLYGHTHYPLVYNSPMGSTVVNPGSVGQPRQPNCKDACWAIIDTITLEVSLQKSSYNLSPLLYEINRFDKDIEPKLSSFFFR